MVGEWGCSLMVWYDPKHRPPQTTPPRDAFTIHRSVGRDRVSIAYLREGRGYPLVLLHGYPETKRIWWRNVEPLAAAGFEVIAPDLRGYGDSELSPDDHYGLAVYSRDVHALVHDELGRARCSVIAGDVGGAAAIDLLHRFPGFVDRLCFFDTVPPIALDAYAAAFAELGDFANAVKFQRQALAPPGNGNKNARKIVLLDEAK